MACEEVVVERELGIVTVTFKKCKERTQLGWILRWTQELPRKESQKISDIASFMIILHSFPQLDGEPIASCVVKDISLTVLSLLSYL